jgi:hypothetical protein
MIIKFIKYYSTIRNLTWLIYIGLLGVLLPHTAWAFERVQSSGSEVLAWMLAFVFEASIFVLTHNMVGRIEKSGRLRGRDKENKYGLLWRRFSVAYLNINALGLLSCCAVSALANWTYTVEFAEPVKTFGEYSVPPALYHISFGGILPLVSLMFAHILARPAPDEHQPNESEAKAKAEARVAKKASGELRQQLEELQSEFDSLQSQAEILQSIFADEKRERILAAHKLFPDINGAAIASIAKAAPSYVSSVLTEMPRNGHRK